MLFVSLRDDPHHRTNKSETSHQSYETVMHYVPKVGSLLNITTFLIDRKEK